MCDLCKLVFEPHLALGNYREAYADRAHSTALGIK